VMVAQCTGLRAEEVLALEWEDIDFENLSMRVVRAVVHGRVKIVKTEYSEDELPLDPEFATVLLDWKLESRKGSRGRRFNPIDGVESGLPQPRHVASLPHSSHPAVLGRSPYVARDSGHRNIPRAVSEARTLKTYRLELEALALLFGNMRLCDITIESIRKYQRLRSDGHPPFKHRRHPGHVNGEVAKLRQILIQPLALDRRQLRGARHSARGA
jgi:hypothetical protein